MYESLSLCVRRIHLIGHLCQLQIHIFHITTLCRSLDLLFRSLYILLSGSFLNKGATPTWAHACGRSPAVTSRRVPPWMNKNRTDKQICSGLISKRDRYVFFSEEQNLSPRHRQTLSRHVNPTTSKENLIRHNNL